ncbi:MAG: HAD family hydrolase [Gammaproteobacteria bacterium]|nr:HAD family hydrolase [Gammaproteobacteria bacterium]
MAPGRPKAIILDLDDTILDSGDPKVTWGQVCAEFAGSLGIMPGDIFDALSDATSWFWDNNLRAREGRLDLVAARRTIFTRALSALGQEDPDLGVVDAMAQRYTALRDDAVTPFQGAVAALERLRRTGIKLALLTNGSTEKQWAKIREFGLEPYFDHIQVEGDVGFGKPDAQAFRYALSALAARPQETWMVGDNLLADIAGAQGAGIHAIWIDAHGNGLDTGDDIVPDRIVESLDELL